MKRIVLFLAGTAICLFACFTLKAQPVASFTYSPTSNICVNDLVTFTSTSTGANQWVWDFGDFSPFDSTENPTHTYTWGWNFTVVLTAYDTLSGDSDITTQLITVTNPPFAGFWPNPNPVCLGEEIYFSNFSWPNGTSSIWDFDNGDSSTIYSPNYTYSSVGTYAVKLISSNVCGVDTDTVSVVVNTTTPPNIGAWGSPNPVCPNYPVDFSVWGDLPSNTFQWVFGDGDSSTVKNPSHLYTAAGSYDAIVYSSNSCSVDTDTVAITVDAAIVPAVWAWGWPTLTCTTDTVDFNGWGSQLVGYSWDFGDGGSSLIEDPSYAYSDTGTFDAIFTGTNACGNSNSDTVTITIADNAPPNGSFWWSPWAICPNSPVYFQNFSTNYVSSSWDFGDGDTSTADEPIHTFTDTGTYNVRLITTSSCGGIDTLIQPLTVTNTVIPWVWYWYNPWSPICTGVPINFTNFGDTTNSVWDFDDGDSAFTPNVTHVFTDTGLYNVTLSVTNGCGNTAYWSENISITYDAGPPNADIQVWPSAACPGEPFNFQPIVNWSWVDTANVLWVFGDGDSSTITQPIHTYSVSGAYTVTLIVYTDCGNDTVTDQLTVKSGSNPDFTTNIVCLASDPTIFTDGASPTPDTWAWDFGDGDTSTASNPTHVYGTAGTYNATLNVVLNGCVSSITKAVNVVEITSSNSGNNVTCNGACDGDVTTVAADGIAPYTYLWDDPGAQTNATATGLCNGTFNVVITDAAGCTGAGSMSITQPSVLTATLSSSNDASCNGVCDGDATVTAAGGTGPYTYLWSDAQTTSMATGLCAVLYNVTVTDNNVCLDSANVTITEPATLVSSITGSNNASCNGVCDGDATGSAVGGTLPYTYDWNDPGSQTNAMATGLCAGGFNITITDVNGCNDISSVTITQPTVLVSSITGQTNASCNGDCDGDATSSAAGGTAPYTYLWDDPGAQTNSIATGLCAGAAKVVLTDINGCMDSSTAAISEPAVLVASIASFNDASCNSFCDGDATASEAGGTSPYTYDWDAPGGQTTALATGLCAGSFDVEITDTNGCIDTGTATIGEPTAIVLTMGKTDATCGVSNGEASVSAAGGVGPYTYLWDDPGTQTNDTATGLSSGPYTVDVTDNTGCVESGTTSVNDIGAATVSISSSTDVSCDGGSDGSAAVLASGATTPFTYLWDDPGAQTDSTATGLDAGLYTASVTDSNGCIATAIVTINEPAPININFSETDASCNSVCDGSIASTVSGGTTPYTYLWNDPGAQTNATATGLCAGTFALAITDTNGCTDSDTTLIFEPTALIATVVSTNPGCFAACDGSASLTASGGTAPYTYIWTDSIGDTISTVSVVAGLCDATYGITIIDGNGCINSSSLTIVDPLEITLTLASVDATCGISNGEASVSAADGVLPYTYLWDNPGTQTNDTATGLAAGMYAVLVTDNNGCTASGTQAVNNIGAPTVSISSTVNVDCNGDGDGQATVNATGGSTPYAYLWDDPGAQTNATATGLDGGTFNVTVTDSLGCSASTSATINEPAALIGIATGTDALCNGACNGSALVIISGGTAPYTYLWDDPATQTNITANGLCAGTFNVTVTDANGCMDSSSATVGEPTAVSGSLVNTNVTSCGVCDGTSTVTASGGTGAYIYLWNDPAAQTNAMADSLCSGIFTVTITDANSCTATVFDTVTAPGGLIATLSASNNVSCAPLCDGDATIAASGGSGAYTYSWDDPGNQTNAMATGLCSGTYTGTVTDSAGCTSTTGATITGPALLLAYAVPISTSCPGLANGSATATATGGTVPYSYVWDDPAAQTNITATGLAPGTYTVTITDSNNCTSSDTANISSSVALSVDTASVTNVTTNGGSDGAIDITVAGGTSPYAYLWSNSATTENISGLTAGTYTVTVTDSSSCTTTLSVVVSEPTSILEINTLLRFKLYPNPTEGVVNIEVQLQDVQDLEIRVENLIGETLLITPFISAKQISHEIDLGNLPNGIYLIKVATKDGTVNKRIVVTR